MRPRRLEMEGFGAYREPTVVDFEGADLFVLTGATGSGKSTVVDAIVFALYGVVPRYDDRRLVGAAIAQGAMEARVRLDFSVGDDRYTAVRIVRRTRTGATTKEARLERERGGALLAGNADDVSAAAERLLGLGFDQFTKCVVLPQGEFARFLHDKPERRQDLLVKLLDLEVYGRMASAARARADGHRQAVEVGTARLAALADATPDARDALAARVTALGGLRDGIDADLPKVAAFLDEEAAATATATEGRARLALLAAVVVPAGVAELSGAVADHRAALAAATTAVEHAEQSEAQAEQALKARPARRLLEGARDDHDTRTRHLEQQEKGGRVLAERTADEAAAAEAKVVADAALETDRAALDALRTAHRAHALVADLVPGEPCPVCRQVVSVLPLFEAPADLKAAERAVAGREKAATQARESLTATQGERMKVEAKLASIAQQVADLDARLTEHPDPAVVAKELAAVVALEDQLEARRQATVRARKDQLAAMKGADAAQAREATARRTYETERDSVAALGPPARGDKDLAADWAALAAWAGRRHAQEQKAVAAAEQSAAKSKAEREHLLRELAERCAALDVVLGRRSPRDAVVEDLARAEAGLAGVERDLAEAERLRTEVSDLQSKREVAELVGRHLSAKNFEKWVLDEAVGLLVAGATGILLELSGGQYSLTVDDRSGNFQVVDHRNADEVRSARSLSGGETFLASLALALALADQLALLAAKGSARLESIFLDEGFGTLDADTLDVVAAAIEELGARGRMVGLISHVAELAERVPSRFEVTKVGNAATIQRVDR